MIARATDLLLGTDPQRRLRVGRYLYALSVYLFCCGLQVAGVEVGLADGTKAHFLLIFLLVGQATFYLALRSGWSAKLVDPALSMPQMAFANVAIGLAYVVNEHAHSMVTMLMALVLAFSAFVLSPRNCHRLGWLCVATLTGALVLAAGSWQAALTPNVDAFHFLLSAVVLLVMGRLMGQLSALRLHSRAQKQELRVALGKVRQLATHDELTGLANRRFALEAMEQEERKAARSNLMPCLGLIDIDHFKRVNDTLGHAAGDQTLCLLAAMLSEALRPGDLLARWGGEEFLVLLPGTPLSEAARVMERLRERCADPARWAQEPHLQVTFSAGLTSHVLGESVQATIARADAALYRAKEGGRNRIVVA